jgi:hypothetical protein
MSTVLELNCWILAHDPRRVFSVDVPSSKTVSHLKDAIKNKKKPVFDGITADSLDLWMVSNRIQHTDNDESILKGRHRTHDELRSIKVEGDIPVKDVHGWT